MPRSEIMVVEDNSVIAMGFKVNLESMGYAVRVIADSGEEAIRRAP